MGVTTPETGSFPDFWPNSLAVYKDINNHPQLIWGGYPDASFSVTKYKIYRRYSGTAQPVKTTDDDTTFTWTDPDLVFNNGTMAGTDVHYYVVAVNATNGESSPSNTVTVTVPGANPEKRQAGSSQAAVFKSYALEQNYPNPFNPTSQISFSIPQASFVQLKVYDVFGKELNTLVDGFLNEGNHSCEFNGKNLASGVYFYTLKAGNYSATKKMILTK
jgi:hypothetical protein